MVAALTAARGTGPSLAAGLSRPLLTRLSGASSAAGPSDESAEQQLAHLRAQQQRSSGSLGLGLQRPPPVALRPAAGAARSSGSELWSPVGSLGAGNGSVGSELAVPGAPLAPPYASGRRQASA